MEKDANEQANKDLADVSQPATTSPNTNSPTNTTTATTSDTSTNWGSWFIKKKDSYPKSKLNKETSIVDRLKAQDFDSSPDARSSYYEAMGGTGTYTGSSSQNQWMLSQMKAHGFAKGGIISDLIRQSGEDGFALVRRGEGIIPTNMMPEWGQLVQNLQPMNLALDTLKNIHLPEMKQNTNNQNITVNGLTLEFPHVKDANDFITDLQHSKRFENIIHEIAFGKNSLSKYKY